MAEYWVRYDIVNKKWEKSIDGGAWSDLIENPRVDNIYSSAGAVKIALDATYVRFYNSQFIIYNIDQTAYFQVAVDNSKNTVLANAYGPLYLQYNCGDYGIYLCHGTSLMFQFLPYSTAGGRILGVYDQEILQSYDSYLRINQSNSHSSGIWLGGSALRLGSGNFHCGSNGGDGNVIIEPGGDIGNDRIHLYGGTGYIKHKEVYCVAYNSSDVTIGAGTTTGMTYNSNAWDPLGMHSTVSNTGRITIPSGYAGWYIFTHHVRVTSSDGSYFSSWILRNNDSAGTAADLINTVLQPRSAIGTDEFMNVTHPVYMAAGDYAFTRIGNNCATNPVAKGGAWGTGNGYNLSFSFSAHRISS